MPRQFECLVYCHGRQGEGVLVTPPSIGVGGFLPIVFHGMPDMPKYHYTTPEAAAYLSVSRWTLIKWRSQSKGPRWFKIGGSVRYQHDDLAVFAASSPGEVTQ